MRFQILISISCLAALLLLGTRPVIGQEFRSTTDLLIGSSCLHCHDGTEENGLDFTVLGNDLADEVTFRAWVKIHDRISNGEMPPAGEERPNPDEQSAALRGISAALINQNKLDQKENGRVVLRRLTRTELEYSLNDLLEIDAELSEIIPAENAAAGFDTVADAQGLSSLHVQGYLNAVDAALDAALRFDPPPSSTKRRFAYKENRHVRAHIEKKEDRLIVRELDDAIVLFSNASYIYKLDHHLNHDGWYKLRAEAYAYQSEKPVILTLNAGSYQRGFTEVVGFFDLPPGKPKVVETLAYLNAGQYLFPGVADLELHPGGKGIWNIEAEKYRGAGVALKWIEVEGPLTDQWPPKSTTQLLQNVNLKKFPNRQWDHKKQKHFQYAIVPGSDPGSEFESIVNALSPRAFRRPLRPDEANSFVKLGLAKLEGGGDYETAIRVMLRALLTSPNFLFMTPKPGKLDSNSLASRLSFALWKSVPDDELLTAAKEKEFDRSGDLHQQVERMLDHPKAKRFVHDFVSQWLRLKEIDATAPDKQLYPEFDELLKKSMLEETEQFVQHLIDEDLSVSNLIHSDFAFLNRNLAEHYGIEGVEGQQFRKVPLPADSVRGGVLTQASILKVTANGTTTSPVMRGSWVLTHLLGTPPNPPPPSVGSIEPDTRGTTTIREMLDKHRNDSTCASCHRHIDPPGFALENFDVIGGYRDRFRTRGKGDRVLEKLNGRNIWEYKHGLPVDASGQLPSGEMFQGISDYKQLLMRQKEQVARHVISQLVTYATGAEIQFADRQKVETILDACRKSDFGFRTMIHQVIQSDLFRYK